MLGTFGILIKRMDGANRTYLYLTHTSVRCMSLQYVRCQNLKQLLDLCEDLDRTKELSVTIAKTLKILLVKVRLTG